jgi:hypothetical protein
MRTALEILAIVALTYFVLLNGLYLLFTAIAWAGSRTIAASVRTPRPPRSSPRL